MELRSFSCQQFKCYFHLWGNVGPNCVLEFKISKECDAEWILVSPSKHRVALGLLAMHKPPVKSAIKSSSGFQKSSHFPRSRIIRFASDIGFLLLIIA